MSNCQDIQTRLTLWVGYLDEVGFDTEGLGRRWFERCPACIDGDINRCSGPALSFGDAQLVVCRGHDIIGVTVNTSWGPLGVVSHSLRVEINQSLALELQFGPHGHHCQICSGDLGYRWASLPLDLVLATDLLIYSLFPREWARNKNRHELVPILRRSEEDFLRPLVDNWLSSESSLMVRSVCSG